MGGGMILETTFLVDVERELIRKTNGPAQRFLADNPASPLFITFTVAGELAAGPPLSERSRWEALVEPFKILVCTADVCWEYGEAFRYLRTNGRLIGSNDLWIAATAIAFQMPLVTRNLRHFARVPRLQVLSYEGT
jgi:predicted nucleic acid-binding protein